MAFLLIAFLVITLVPLFAASWKMSLQGLSFQGLLLGWIAWRVHGQLSVPVILALVDSVLVRGILAPRALHSVLSSRKTPSRNDVIPSNLFSWALVGGLVFVSFRFGTAMLKTDFANALHLATATAALLLGMFVLSSQNSMFSQMVGLFRIENAIALFELMSPRTFLIPIQVGVSFVFLLTILYFVRFLRDELEDVSGAQPEEEGPTL
jgi:hydrogenase-4 membrane subunit HyfE